MMRSESFALFNDVGRRISGPDTHKKVNVIGLHRQLQNLPALLSTLLLDKDLTVLGNSASQDSFATLGAPD